MVHLRTPRYNLKEIIDPLTVKASTPRGDGNYESGSRRRRIEHAIFPLLRGVEAFTSNGSIISFAFKFFLLKHTYRGSATLIAFLSFERQTLAMNSVALWNRLSIY
jgi:hypothetical protein